jgi:phosphoribosylformylglycinamidine cyclo-ligase
MNYAEAGVSLERAEKAVEGIKASVQSTYNSHVMGRFGGFGGCFDLAGMPEKEPVLVSSVDGVGTKLKVHFDLGSYAWSGEDIVNHCVDDILVQGARPLFFLDYMATGHLKDGMLEAIVGGMSKACRENGCVLIGGETAEMPGFYQDGEYDISGTIVGVAEKSELITGDNVKAGHVILGLPSTGLHTNGYSLARKAVLDHAGYKLSDTPDVLAGRTVGEALATPHRSYLQPIWPLVKQKILDGMVHVTGSGFQGNIPRVLPKDCNAIIDRAAWPVPGIFQLIQQAGQVERDEMYNTFNMGIGMLLFVKPEDAASVRKQLEEAGETVYAVGVVESGDGSVKFSS